MKAPRTLRDHLLDIGSKAYDLQSAARLLETKMDTAPVTKIPVPLQHFVNDADWLSRQISTLADTIAAAAGDASLLTNKDGGAT
jgi:hypothetical protein